jgi:group I intron endonuclease
MSKTNYYMKKTCGVYVITHKETGKQYVGQSLDVCIRWKQHTSGKKTAIAAALREEGLESWTFEVLEECKAKELLQRENYWIEKLGTLHPRGYNMNSGSGGRACEESKEKMRAAAKGQSSPRKGVKLSEETKAKQSASLKETYRKRKEKALACKYSD